jgi:hypothetical protein
MVLDRNCRNTDAIHAAAYRHYRGAPVEPPQISGVAVECLVAGDLTAQAKAICGLVTRLLTGEAVEPHDVAILLCDPSDRLERERTLKSLPLPKTAKLGRIEDFEKGLLTVDTVARFKGLERGVIILWAFDRPSLTADRETLYVGMSRAKSVLYLCGTRAACNRIFVSQTR